jgi:stage II sporulation protein D
VKNALALLVGVTLIVAPQSSLAATAPDAAGRDVSVALFSTRTVRSVTISPVGANAWIAWCTRCIHKTLTQPLHLTGPTEMFAGGMLRIADDGSGDTQTAAGLWHVRANRQSLELHVVLTLPSEHYVAAVLNAEAAPNEPAQSLQALAIVARTYALNGNHFTPQSGGLPAELCDSTQCQAMRLGLVSPAIEQAVQETAGETLWFGAQRAEVFFSQSCGGLTEDGEIVWPNLHGLPYLQGHRDPYCLRRGTEAWHSEIRLTDFVAIAKAEGWRIPDKIVAARVAARSPSHRALRIVFTGDKGAEPLIAASSLRFAVGRALGWNRLRSDAYELGLRNGTLVFDGHGHGHGVGLCQLGATEMASEGSDAKAILSFYFPGTAVRITPHDEGWHETHFGSITLRSTGLPSSDQEAAWGKSVQRAWNDALQRFPPHKAIAPQIVLAPTTELFRQMTAQPGWALASTRSNTIVLQPESVLVKHGPSSSATLLHEMLHVLVESEASKRAPLWLREGLVEVLAGEAEVSTSSLSTNDIERTLTSADSWAASERAHRAAAARVKALIARYGVSTVRGWLSSGPPSGVA